MKKFIVATSVIGLMLFSGVALASTDDLPDAGITPDSPLYFLDNAGESINEFFSLSHESKSEKKLKHAEEKLAEAKKMAEEGKTDATEVAEKKYEEKLDGATEEAKLTGKENALQRIEEATIRHQAVMERVLSQVPEQAKASIQKAMDKSSKGHQNATDAINKVKANQTKNSGSNSNKPE